MPKKNNQVSGSARTAATFVSGVNCSAVKNHPPAFSPNPLAASRHASQLAPNTASGANKRTPKAVSPATNVPARASQPATGPCPKYPSPASRPPSHTIASAGDNSAAPATTQRRTVSITKAINSGRGSINHQPSSSPPAPQHESLGQ